MAVNWWEGPLLAIDTETSGVDYRTDRLVTVALVEADATNRTSTTEHWVLDCGVEIPDEAAQIHGYTTERVRAEGVKPETVIDAIAGQMRAHMDKGLPVVAYNASFDFSFLNAELGRLDLPPLTPYPVVDPFVVDKHVDKYRRGRRTLTASADHYKVALDGAHDAAADAITAARLAWRIGQLPPVCDMTLDELHTAQIGWAKEQADSLRAYFESKGTDASDVDGTWPVRA